MEIECRDIAGVAGLDADGGIGIVLVAYAQLEIQLLGQLHQQTQFGLEQIVAAGAQAGLVSDIEKAAYLVIELALVGEIGVETPVVIIIAGLLFPLIERSYACIDGPDIGLVIQCEAHAATQLYARVQQLEIILATIQECFYGEAALEFIAEVQVCPAVVFHFLVFSLGAAAFHQGEHVGFAGAIVDAAADGVVHSIGIATATVNCATDIAAGSLGGSVDGVGLYAFVSKGGARQGQAKAKDKAVQTHGQEFSSVREGRLPGSPFECAGIIKKPGALQGFFLRSCTQEKQLLPKRIAAVSFPFPEALMTDALRPAEKAVSLTPYLLLGFLALVLALIVRAPASLLQKAVPAGLPVQVSAWGGTVWEGQAGLQMGGNPGFLEWQVQQRRLLAGRLAMNLQSRGEMTLTGHAELGSGNWALSQVQGEIPSSVLQALLPPGWSLPGSVQAENLELARRGHGNGPWTAAGGRLRWGGGAMQYRLENQTQAATLPALVVNVLLEGDTLVLALNEEAGNLGLALLRLEPDGTVEARVRERLLRYTPGYRSSGGDADAVVVTARQKL